MNTKFGIRNFRVFGERGVSFDLNPITILTGENSSGKSTLVKAMILMRNYFRAVRNEPTQNPAAVQLDFSDPALNMSGFESALTKTSTDAHEISFSYEAESDFAPFPFEVEYAFVKDEDNQTKGELKDIKIRHDNQLILQFENAAGNLILKEFDFQQWIDFFKNYIKGIEYSKSIRSCKGLDFENVYEARSKNGILVTDWKKFNHDCFSTIETRKKDKIRPDKSEDPELVSSIKKLEDTGLLFYFPLLEETDGLSKEQALDLLRSSTVESLGSKWKELVKVFDNSKEDVLKAFESSSYEKFIDFLKDIEKQVLSSIIKTKAPRGFLGLSTYIDALFGQDIFSESIYGSWGFSKKKPTLPQKIYAFLHILHFAKSEKSDEYIKRNISPMDFTSDGEPCNFTLTCQHHLKSSFLNFLPLCISELICPCIFDSLTYVGSSFTPVQRLHSYDEHSGLTLLLKEYRKCVRIIKQNKKLDNKSALLNYATIDHHIGAFVNKWLKNLGIAQELVIKEDVEGLGFRLYLKKDKHNMLSLADEGRGITQIVLILLHIEVAIMQHKIANAGFRNDQTVCSADHTLTIEEPEVSLHPCWQSIIADIFVDANNAGIHFIVETHSEYMIRKTQAIVANYTTPEEFYGKPFVVYYIKRNGEAYELEYTESGRFANSFGQGFFDESRRSNVEVLKRERRIKDEA